jgi:hypothetical protein
MADIFYTVQAAIWRGMTWDEFKKEAKAAWVKALQEEIARVGASHD